MKIICRNCHFLAKEYREENTGRVFSFSLSESERELVRSDPNNAVKEHYSLKCQLGVWDEGVSQLPGGRHDTLNITVRKDSCFFFPNNPAMLFDAARELQKRESENRQLKRANLYTRIGLWIAAGALVANAVIAYFKD
ncbi:MAG: hypothetical protein FJ246_01160 [Nitrospira sp.]|nr:hypothetical protein [Nitrospira sp.]